MVHWFEGSRYDDLVLVQVQRHLGRTGLAFHEASLYDTYS